MNDERRKGRSDGRLCAQVSEALGFALAESDEDALASAWIEDVVPAPNVARLRVIVRAAKGIDADALLARLEALAPSFRYEIANAINRKKTPQLCFVVLPADSPSEA